MAARDNLYRRPTGVVGAVLIGSSLLGGVASVLAGTNTWANAWTADATLAAPWPMLVVQTAATWAAIQRRRAVALAGSALLGLTAAVAGISGFFDGQLGRADLGAGMVAGQVCYLVVAWATVLVAGLRLWSLGRADRASASPQPDAGSVL
jgi:hypothetical protein